MVLKVGEVELCQNDRLVVEVLAKKNQRSIQAAFYVVRLMLIYTVKDAVITLSEVGLHMHR